MEFGAAGVAVKALTSPCGRMHHRNPARHVGDRDADKWLGTRIEAKLNRSPSPLSHPACFLCRCKPAGGALLLLLLLLPGALRSTGRCSTGPAVPLAVPGRARGCARGTRCAPADVEIDRWPVDPRCNARNAPAARLFGASWRVPVRPEVLHHHRYISHAFPSTSSRLSSRPLHHRAHHQAATPA